MKIFNFLNILVLLALFAISCEKEYPATEEIVQSLDYSEKDWQQLSGEVSNPESFKTYLSSMYDENHQKKSFTESTIKSLGNPNSDINLLAAISVSESFEFLQILWEEIGTEEVNVGGPRGSTYKKRIGSQSYYSFWCLGVKVDADVWYDIFSGGCNPSYYVSKRRKKVCSQSINCY